MDNIILKYITEGKENVRQIIDKNPLLKQIAEEKTQIDEAFNVLLVKAFFLDEQNLLETGNENGQYWLDVAIKEYRQVKCDGCL
jgi:hypothetical protein